jgi:hypothetical protein
MDGRAIAVRVWMAERVALRAVLRRAARNILKEGWIRGRWLVWGNVDLMDVWTSCFDDERSLALNLGSCDQLFHSYNFVIKCSFRA